MKQITLLAALLLSLQFVQAQAGMLDSSFGGDGKVHYDSLKGYYRAIAIQKDGKIVVGGYKNKDQINKDEGCLIERFNNDGSPDESFGIHGKVIIFFEWGEYINGVVALAIDKHGKIVICTPCNKPGSGNNDVGLIRLNADGSIDTKFNKNGFTSRNIGYSDDIGDMILQTDGKIVVGGRERDQVGNEQHSFLIRFLPDGRPDTSFGDKGKALISLYANSYPGALTQQADGKILFGKGYGAGPTLLHITRYNTDGSIDSSFSADGMAVLTPPYFALVQFNDITVQDDGKILAAGQLGNELFVARFDSTGKVDSAFGNNYGYYHYTNGYATAGSIFTTEHNKILISGIINIDSAKRGLALFRLLKKGMPDSSFADNGIALANFSNDLKKAYPSVGKGALQKDGKIVVLGQFKFLLGLARFYIHDKQTKTKSSIKDNNTGIAKDKLINIKLYPNPASNILHIEGLPANTKTKLTITDLNGNARMAATANAVSFAWNISRLQKGSYVVRGEANGTVTNTTFIKE